MKNKISLILLLGFIFCANVCLFAQDGPGDTGDGGLEGGDPAPAPINSHLYLLLIVAFLYAGFKLRHYKKVIN